MGQTERVTADIRISIILKGNTLGAHVTPACSKQQVCENSWVRQITRVKRVDRRKMDDLGEELCIQTCQISEEFGEAGGTFRYLHH